MSNLFKNLFGKRFSEKDIVLTEFIKEKIEKGQISLVIGPTPMGGDYAECHYLDIDHNYTAKEESAVAIIRECKKNGELIQETVVQKNNK